MAKRKRLSPPRFETGAQAAPETKSAFPTYPLGIAPTRTMPIAAVAGDAAGRAALDEMSRSMDEARAEGRLIQWLPIAEIDAGYLMRDRMGIDEEEMQTLVESLRARGQQVAIEVADLGEGASPRWGLISGWRRLSALRRIAEEDGAEGRVLAIPRSPRNAAEAYCAMVEENEIRVGLSHYERARIVARAADAGVYEDDMSALRALFGAAPRARRSKIGSFVRVVRALDAALRFPTALGERLGLELARRLDDEPDLAARLSRHLSEAAPEDAAAEAKLLEAELFRSEAPETTGAPRRPARPAPIELQPGLSCRETPKGLLISGALLERDGVRERILALLREEMGG